MFLFCLYSCLFLKKWANVIHSLFNIMLYILIILGEMLHGAPSLGSLQLIGEKALLEIMVYRFLFVLPLPWKLLAIHKLALL